MKPIQMKSLGAVWIGLILVIGSLGLGVMLTDAQEVFPALTPLEAAHVAEIRHLLTLYADDVWPGWENDLPGMLLRKGDYDLLIGYSTPPKPFMAMPGVLIDDEPVFSIKDHLLPVLVATAWQVGDEWVLALPVRDEFQIAVDQQLGKGMLVLDDIAFIRTGIHEAFHAYQMAISGGAEGLPVFVTRPDNSWLENLTEDERTVLDRALAAEGQILSVALADSTTDADVYAAVEEFLRLREKRRSDLPAQAADFEQGVEWLEGAARYIDTNVMMLAGSPNYKPSEEAKEDKVNLIYPAANVVWDDFLAQLKDLTSIPGNYRDRLYVLGAAQMFLLNRMSPDWQEELLLNGRAPEHLLAEIVQS